MFKRLTLAACVLVLLAASVEATSVYRGKRGRRYARNAYLISQFQSDKLRVYEEYGFPVHRLRVKGYGRITEHWKYYELGKEFVFDENSRLVKVNTFWPEDRRARFK
ncbi:MAG: hypothetical protein JXB45_06465 [Candidatus Krumholzibacteriota bacterium]|nr:hypothetical protein [Candidatus Krumholzibacteriota bacterium]